jgi:hypothetical protein
MFKQQLLCGQRFAYLFAQMMILRQLMLMVVAFIVAVAILSFVLIETQILGRHIETAVIESDNGPTTRATIGFGKVRHESIRALIIIPYFTKFVPVWFQSFLSSTTVNEDLIDWIIFASDETNLHQSFQIPSNVRIEYLSYLAFAQRLLELLAANDNRQKGKKTVYSSNITTHDVGLLSKFLERHPYVIVEFKPMLGAMFRDYLHNYSHWGYGDLDVLMGNISMLMNDRILNRYDIINYTFGDHYSLYLRAQLVILRAHHKTLQLWERCSYFSNIILRVHKYYYTNHWSFESAEGCISKVAVDNANLSIIYLPVQFSDAFAAPLADREVLMWEDESYRCYGTPFSPHKVFDIFDESNFLSPKSIHRSNRRCSYWISPQYDVRNPSAVVIILSTYLMFLNIDLRKQCIRWEYYNCDEQKHSEL